MASTTTRKRRAIGYVRVSRVNGRNGENYISPDYQRERIAAIAATKGLELVAVVQDEDASGGTNDRPAFQDALARIEDGDASALVVAYQSRFARSLAGTYESLGRLDAAGAELYAGDVDGNGKVQRAVMTALGEEELDRISAQWLDARERAVTRGAYIATVAPLGYRFTNDSPVKHERDTRLLVDEPVAEAVREVFRSRAAGASWSSIAADFAKATGRVVHPGSLKRVVSNRAYLGEVRHGELVNADAHVALVTLGEFEAAQAKSVRPARSKTGSLLAGVLRCESCGGPMSYRGGKSGAYTCGRFRNGVKCEAPVLVKADLVDPYVEAAFVERYFGKVAAARGVPSHATELHAAEAELERASADLTRTLSLDLGELVDADAYRAVVTEKQAAKDDAASRLAELRESAGLDERLVALEDVWHELSVEERRPFMAQAFSHVTVRRIGPGRRAPIEERVELHFAADQESSAAADPVAA